MSVSAVARAEIVELLARYAWSLDLDDAAAVPLLFIEDGVFDGVSGWYKGREQIRSMAAKSRAADLPHLVQHWCSNLLFDGDDNECTVRSMCIGPSVADGCPGMAFVATYVDRCIRTTAGWRFAYRRWRPWDGKLPQPSTDSRRTLS